MTSASATPAYSIEDLDRRPADRSLRLEATRRQAETDRIVLTNLLRQATEARDSDRSRGADPVLLCHHAELLSLLIRRLAETELRVVRTRLESERYRAALTPRTAAAR